MNTNLQTTNKKWKTNNNNTIKYIIIGNERRVIPVGDPPEKHPTRPETKEDYENLKTYNSLKKEVIEKMAFLDSGARAEAQEISAKAEREIKNGKKPSL